MSQGVTEFIEHLSEQPWSNYTAADYSIEQWHNSCLIHQHEGPPTSKSQCKLPVKTPGGALNKNGVHAAAAALAGARGGVHASTEEKAKAARALRGYYGQMNEKPPPSLMKHANVLDFIDHHGVKGQKWGVRRNRKGAARGTARTVYSKSPKNLTNAELERRIKRMDTEKKYNSLNKRDVSKGQQFAAEVLTSSGRTIATTVLAGAGLFAIKAVLNKKFPGSEAASMITKRKK